MILGLLGQDCPAVVGRPPAIEALVEQLERGHVVLEGLGFKAGRDQLHDATEPVLEQTARALNRTPGRFAVFVPAEREGNLPADTVLGRRRSSEAFRRLLAVGANPQRLVVAGSVLRGGPLGAVVGVCMARVELWRV